MCGSATGADDLRGECSLGGICRKAFFPADASHFGGGTANGECASPTLLGESEDNQDRLDMVDAEARRTKACSSCGFLTGIEATDSVSKFAADPSVSK